MCHSSIFSLSLKPRPLFLLPLSFIHSWNLRHTHRSTHTKTFDISWKVSLYHEDQWSFSFFFLTLLSPRGASHGCTGRRSTPPLHEKVPPLMPNGHDVQRTPAQLPWSLLLQRSSSGPTQTLDLKRYRAKSQRNSYYWWITYSVETQKVDAGTINCCEKFSQSSGKWEDLYSKNHIWW